MANDAVNEADRIERLRRRYGAQAIDHALSVHAHDALDLIEWADELDPHYTRLWLEFIYTGMYRRGVLDERTRNLVLVGQYVALNEMDDLGHHIRSALRSGAGPREVLEVVLQSTVYFGWSRARRAARVCRQVLADLGRLDEIAATQLPLEGREAERSLEAERATWKDDFPRRDEWLGKYGWLSLSPGLRLQPGHHVHTVERADRVDPHFTKVWLDCIYRGMYMRGVLDDKTRILCIVGELFVAGDVTQAENHMRGALVHGASPREVLEVILQSTIHVGMPRFIRFVAALERILEEQGRMAELTATQLPLPGG